ncbi:MAG: hypothetical protein DRJ62_08020 [Thermoprotei archaeon]|nr:MAG: hypothetical protein DRJ62_08020 [Thermoprotei archaeon]
MAAAGAVLALAVLAILYFMPIPQPYTDATSIASKLRDAGVPWWSAVEQLYNSSYLESAKLGSTLWGFRAIDVFAQAFLILAAACGVTALFRLEPPKEVAEEEEAVVEAPLEEEEAEEV